MCALTTILNFLKKTPKDSDNTYLIQKIHSKVRFRLITVSIHNDFPRVCKVLVKILLFRKFTFKK